MTKATLLVLPSTHEGMPLVLMEAAACGLPVVVSDIAAAAETGLAARLVPPDDPAAWATALRELLADDALRGRLAAEAAGRARGFRWEHVVEQWLGLYEQVAVLDR
jgi:glycosyltransferase involved in cell wall biosynthesis